MQVGELVSKKLHYHFLVGHMIEHAEERQHLSPYVESFDDQGQLYEAYPNAALSFVWIHTVGKLLMAVGDGAGHGQSLSTAAETVRKSGTLGSNDTVRLQLS